MARTGADPAVAVDDGLPITLAGHVLDGAGKPVAGIDVDLGNPRGDFVATSGADGAYHVALTTGTWSLRASGAGAWAQPEHLVLHAAANATISHDVVVERAGSVHGRALTAAGEPVAGATVSIEGADPATRTALDEFGGPVTTDGAGQFELAAPPGEVHLRAELDTRVGFAVAPAVAPGADATVDIVLTEPGAIAGRVVDAAGHPVAAATVQVYSSDPQSGGTQRLEGTSDASGAYRIAGIHAGELTVSARSDAGASPPTHVALAAGADQDNVDLAFGAPVAMRGTVIDGSHAAVGGARIRVSLDGSRSPLATVTSDGDGSFTVPGAIVGGYQLTVTADGRSARQHVDLTADAPPIQVVVAAAGGIRGHVVADEADNAELADVSVSIEHFTPAGADRPAYLPATSATFAGDGGFTLPNLAPGSYDLLVRARGHAAQHVAGVIVPDGGWADVPVTLGRGGRVTGVVTSDGAPLAGARVSIDGGAIAAFTDGAGRFALDAVPLGPVTVTVADTGHPSAQRAATVSDAGTALAIDLSADGGSDVEGIGVILRDDGGRAIVNGIMYGAPAAGQVPNGATIVAVDGTPVTAASAIARIRGPAGTQVTLSLSQGTTQWQVTLTRARVSLTGPMPTIATLLPRSCEITT